MTTAEHAGRGTAAAGPAASRRTPTGIRLTAVRPGRGHDDGAATDPGVPTDPVDAAVRRRSAGPGGATAVLRALLDSTLYLPADAEGRVARCAGGPMGYATVFSHPRQAPASSPRLVPVTASWLVAALPATTTLWINPEGDAPYCVFVDDLQGVAAAPVSALFGARHRDGTDSALRPAYGRLRRRSTISGEPDHGHAHDGPAERDAASRPVPLPGP